MNTEILKKIEASQYKNRPDVRVGDTVKLHMRIKEGNKERTQIFEGLVLAMKGSGISQTVTVRKMSSGVAVERIVPVHSPLLEKIEVVKRGTVKKGKLYYTRERIGKKALRVSNLQDLYLSDQEAASTEESVEAKEEATAEPVVTEEAK